MMATVRALPGAPADAPIRGTFETEDPVGARVESGRGEYFFRVEAPWERFRKDDAARELFLAALGHVGVDPRRTSWDWPYPRVSPNVDGGAPARPRAGSIPWATARLYPRSERVRSRNAV